MPRPFPLVVRALALLVSALVFACAAGARADGAEQCASSYENAQVFRMRGRYVEARDALLVCLKPTCSKLLRDDCLAWLPQVEASLPSVVFAVTDANGNDVPGARVFANDKPLSEQLDGRAHAIDPGVYKLRFEAPGYRSEEQTLTIREAEKNRMVRARMTPDGSTSSQASRSNVTSVSSGELAPADSVPERKVPVVTWVLGGVSVASLGAFVGFGLKGKSRLNELEDECSPYCSPKSTESGRRDYVIANVAAGLSLASAAGAVVSYFLLRPKDEEVANVALHVDRDRATLGYTGRF